MENKTPPVNVGDILQNQEVISEGKKSDGVVKYEGYIIFVNNCSKGDVVTLKITKVFPAFGVGEKTEE
jgi:predicted RNA-binding protein with TRAM domain